MTAAPDTFQFAANNGVLGMGSRMLLCDWAVEARNGLMASLGCPDYISPTHKLDGACFEQTHRGAGA